MDRRLAVGLLGTATLGALTTGDARADDAEPNPLAARLTGRRVVVFTSDMSYEGTVDVVSGSLLYLRDLRWQGVSRVREAVVDISRCNIVGVLDEPAKAGE